MFNLTQWWRKPLGNFTDVKYVEKKHRMEIWKDILKRIIWRGFPSLATTAIIFPSQEMDCAITRRNNTEIWHLLHIRINPPYKTRIKILKLAQNIHHRPRTIIQNSDIQGRNLLGIFLVNTFWSRKFLVEFFIGEIFAVKFVKQDVMVKKGFYLWFFSSSIYRGSK